MRSLTLLIVLLAVACRGDPGDRFPAVPPGVVWESLRETMVLGIRDREVEDERVLDALGRVPRHLFVPGRHAARAYELKPLPIGDGQTISDPYIVGIMTELLELTGGEKVLEIGTGSGYQAAVLSLLVPTVYSIEIRPRLAEAARERLVELGYGNVVVRCGDGYRGWPAEAPFDAIIVTAAPPEVPEALLMQLAPGGRLVVPVGSQDRNQDLTVIRKSRDGEITERKVWPVRFVPMIRED